MGKEVCPHADQEVQRAEGSELIRGTRRRVFEVHKDPVGDVLLLLATRVDGHAQPSGTTTPSKSTPSSFNYVDAKAN